MDDYHLEINRAKRIKRPFLVNVRALQKESKSEKSPGWDMVIVRDLSSSGISFKFNKEIALGTDLEFNIRLPISAEPLYCRGLVWRVDKESIKTTAGHIYIIAAHFTEMDSDKKEAIDRLSQLFSPGQQSEGSPNG